MGISRGPEGYIGVYRIGKENANEYVVSGLVFQAKTLEASQGWAVWEKRARRCSRSVGRGQTSLHAHAGF